MFKAIAKASAEIYKRCGENPPSLEIITQVVIGVTAIDKVVFVKFDSTPENPICGSFQKWVQRPTTYSSLETWVEIRYASHLDNDWLRFVVCKELCHALEDDDGCHSVSPGSIDNLVNAFSLRSKNQIAQAEKTRPITAEFLAEAGALELLCPMPIRRRLVERGADLDQYCVKYGFPDVYAWFAFGPKWMDAVDGFMKAD